MQVQTSTVSAGAAAETMDVRFISGEAYEVAVRGHTVTVDQPAIRRRRHAPRRRRSCSWRRWPPVSPSTPAGT